MIDNVNIPHNKLYCKLYYYNYNVAIAMVNSVHTLKRAYQNCGLFWINNKVADEAESNCSDNSAF